MLFRSEFWYIGGALYKHRGKYIHYGFDGNVCLVGYKLGEFQIGLEEMIAFGDDENDYEIITNVGCGIAVDNAIPMIKEVADDITESNDDDGVAKYIERLFLC